MMSVAVFRSLLFLIPAIGMIAGLSVGLMVCFLMVLPHFIPHPEEQNAHYSQNRIFIKIFAAYCLLSCLWSPDVFIAAKEYMQVFIPLIAYLYMPRIYLRSLDQKYLIYGILVAMLLFWIEYLTNGVITTKFKEIFQVGSTQFVLYMLDRGCSLFAVTAWLVIWILINNKKPYQAAAFYVATFILLMLSDSLAGFISFISASFVCFMINFFGRSMLGVFRKLFISSAILFPLAMQFLNAYAVSERYDFLPWSAKHRLFIWEFVLSKITANPIFGYGFGYSRSSQVIKSDIIMYQGVELPLIPLHPHNNILQILLETGIVGYSLFLCALYFTLKHVSDKKIPDQNNWCCSIVYAAFTNYFIIGMISFSIWQLWWVCTGIWIAILINSLVIPKESSK